MRKKIAQLSLVAFGVVSVSGFTKTSFALENSDAISEATITAVAGNTAVPPVDPNDPKNPDKPGPDDSDDGNTTGQSGPLQINYLSNLDFGDNIAITSRTVTASVKNKTPRFFQVSDLRGTGSGWKLNVSLGDFNPTDSNSTAGPITGAKISFKNGKVATSNVTDADAATVNNVELNAGVFGVETLLLANQGDGRGTWLAKYSATSAKDNENIVFSAPTNSISAETDYQATLTWQLVDGAN